jgi:hypothetical protein
MWAVYARGTAEPFDEHLNDEEAKTLSGINVGGRRTTRNVRTRNLYAKPYADASRRTFSTAG